MTVGWQAAPGHLRADACRECYGAETANGVGWAARKFLGFRDQNLVGDCLGALRELLVGA